MHYRWCRNPLEKPGDYCLTYNTASCGAVVTAFAADRVTLTFPDGEDVFGETTVTTIPESDDEMKVVQLRNFTDLVADKIWCKRPGAVYAAGEHALPREIRTQFYHEFYHVSDDSPAQCIPDTRGERTLKVVDIPSAEKLGESRSTLIGGQWDHRAIDVVADHPYIKKVISDPIDADGTGSQAGLQAKVVRTGGNGNVKLLLRDGPSVQENRIVTAAMNRETGERIRNDLDEALREDRLQDE